MIPQERIDWLAYDQHVAQGGTDKAFAESIGETPNNFAQKKRRHRRNQATHNGNLPAIQTPAHPDALQRTSALPVHSDASELADIRARLDTLEAFMAAIQSAHHSASERISALPVHPNAPAHRSAPERTEPPTWVSRGMHVSTDMLAAIDAYAAKHRLEKRLAHDELLRIAVAVVEGQVHDA